jgi:hypothetical protein
VKLQLALKDGDINYRIETVVTLPDFIMEKYKVSEAGFSPNPLHPVNVYICPRKCQISQTLLDYILDSEVKSRFE